VFIITNLKYIIIYRLLSLLLLWFNHFLLCLLLLLKDEIKATAEYLMIQLDPDLTGFVTEPQFIENVKLNYSEY